MPQSMLSFLLKMTKQFLGAIAAMNNALADLGLEQHPDKTTIGPTAHGFGFLGHTYSAAGLGLAWLGLAEKTIRNHGVKLHRLYEEYLRARKGAPRAQIEAAITTYIARWKGWVTGGLHGTFELDAACFTQGQLGCAPKFILSSNNSKNSVGLWNKHTADRQRCRNHINGDWTFLLGRTQTQLRIYEVRRDHRFRLRCQKRTSSYTNGHRNC